MAEGEDGGKSLALWPHFCPMGPSMAGRDASVASVREPPPEVPDGLPGVERGHVEIGGDLGVAGHARLGVDRGDVGRGVALDALRARHVLFVLERDRRHAEVQRARPVEPDPGRGFPTDCAW